MDGQLQRERTFHFLNFSEQFGRLADFRSRFFIFQNLQPGYTLQSFCFTKRISASIPAAEEETRNKSREPRAKNQDKGASEATVKKFSISVAQNDIGDFCVMKKLECSVKKDLVFERGKNYESISNLLSARNLTKWFVERSESV